MKNMQKSNSFIAGSYKKHFWNKEYEYQSFWPTPVNRSYEWKDKRISVSGLQECRAAPGIYPA